MATATLTMPAGAAHDVLSSGPLTSAPKAAPRLREFGDALATRKEIYDSTLDAARHIAPLEDDKHRLELSDVDWADPERYPKKKRKQAILTGQTLARRLKGTWTLVDKTSGKVLDKREQVVARVPYLSSMGTFVHRGNEYTVSHQQRLLPGVFARVKDNGEIESHFNVLPGKGVSHRYFLEPEKGVFKIRVGQAEMPLMPLLRAMGATDAEIRRHWGDALWQTNYGKNDASVLTKLKNKFLSKKDLAEEGSSTQKLVDKFNNMELDPEVTKRTLGHPFDRVSKDAILAATGKLLRVSRGEADPDDRDALAYQKFYGPEDLFAERLLRDHGGLRRALFRKAAFKGHLRDMPSGALTPQIEQVLLGSGLAQALEEINPAEVFDKQTRVTRMGEGGIPSLDAIPDEARSVQPSHMGFMDPLRTPECYDELTEVMTRNGWKFWRDVKDSDELACNLDGRLDWRRPEALHRSHYRGEMVGVRTATLNYLVTPNHRLWVRPKDGNGQYRVETAEESYLKPRFYATGHLPISGSAYKRFDVPAVERLSNNTNLLPDFDIDDWCELLGWYLGEGLTIWREHTGDYRTCISQSRTANPENCDRIEKLLDRMTLTWSYNASMSCYVLCGKQLTAYFRQFGCSPERYIPEELLSAPTSARERLLESLLLAEGRRDRNGRRYQFCSTSRQLADGVQRLAFSLGKPTTMRFEKDNRQPQYLGCYVVHMHGRTEREVGKRHYYKTDYDGTVYCATVPGGLLYVRRGETSGHWSGNSFRVGVDLHVARGARKGNDGRLYTRLRDKKGDLVWRSPQDIADAAVATPDVMTWPTKRVPVMRGGKLTYVPKNQIDYVLPHFEDAFSPLANLIPLKSMVKGQRVAMGSRYLTQALPLAAAEAPLVQAAVPGSKGLRSFEEEYGKHMGAVVADQAGRVESIRDGVVRLRHADGSVKEVELYQHYPFNRKSVTGDTEIFVKRGTEVWPTRIDEYEWQIGDLTLSVDPVTKLSAWSPVTGYTKHRNDKKLLLVRTRSGREVVVTEDHSLITLGDDGEMTPIYPKECVVGKTRLPVARLPEPDVGSHDCESQGILDGLYLAEGHCPPAQPGLVCIAVADDARAEQVVRFLRGRALSAYRNGGNVCFTDHGTCERLTKFFGHLSHNKRVPDWVFSSSYHYRRGLVCGYMAGDGCLSTDSQGAVQLTAVSVSKKLRDGLVDVLSSLGVFVTMFDADRSHLNDAWRDGHGFRVPGRQICKLNRWFFYADREAKLRKLLRKVYRSSEFEAVPVTKAGRKVLYSEFAVVPKYVHKTALLGAVAKLHMYKCTGVYGQWAKSDVMWDAIVSIEEVPHQEYVYDLSVAKSEAFAVCHGLIVHNTYIHQTPLVEPGQHFAPGQPLVKSNYTDHNGATALGVNLRAAYMPWKGYNYEDAQVISETAARRMSSEHMYQHDLEVTPRHKVGKRAFVSLFPTKFDRATLDRLDDQGLVHVGQRVEYGDPLILAAKERDRAQNKIHKRKQAGYNDESVIWKHHDPGVVTDVVWGKNGPVVLVKSVAPMRVGDKMSGRYGDKGVVAAIVPDHEMPHDKDGKPYEVLLNPLGIITRTNPSQMAEAWLGKIAEKTGRPVKVPDFENEPDMMAWVKRQLARHGLSDTEDVIEPKTGRKIRGVATGNRFFMKLHHTAECFDDQTEVLTSEGWLNWAEVTPEHRLATQRDGQMVFERPIRLYDAPFDGEMLHYEGRYVDYTVTPNHRLLLRYYHRKSAEFVFEEASRAHGRRFAVPQFGIAHTEQESVAVPIAGISAGDYAELVGWWASEGYAKVTPRHACVVVYQSREANPEKFARIEALATRLGFPWHYYRSRGQYLGVCISHRGLAEHLKKCGTKSHNKRLPRELLRQPPDVLRRAYDAMLASDGNHQDTAAGPRARYTTVSKGLADDFQELCVRAGFGAIVRRCKDRAVMQVRLPDGRSYLSACLPVWECGVALVRKDAQIDGDRNPQGFQRVRYSGRVYCAEMATGLLYVRRNGKPMWSGNSKGQGRGSGAYSMDETPAKGGETGCFVGSTPVALWAALGFGRGSTPAPTHVTIADIVDNRYDMRNVLWQIPGEELRLPECGEVTDWFRYRVLPEELVTLTLASGEEIGVTKNHEFVLSDGSRKRAGELAEGDDLMEVYHG